MRLAICKNTTENNNHCHPDQKIREDLKTFFVQFLYKDSFIDNQDLDDPVKYFITSNTLKSSSLAYRRDYFIYKNIDYNTDTGILLSEFVSSKHSALLPLTTDSVSDPETGIFTNVLFGLNNIKEVYDRKYIKVQDVAAQVGGIIKLFMIVINFTVEYISYIPFLDELYDMIYAMNHDDNNTKYQKINLKVSNK